MDTTPHFQSHVLKGILIGLGIVLILVVGFAFNQVVGWRHGNFFGCWGNSYQRNFGGGPRGGFVGSMMGGQFAGPGMMYSNGVAGAIVKIEGNNLTVKDRDNTEKVVAMSDQTTVVSPVGTIQKTDLKVGNNIVVIGSANAAGQVDAKFIRVFP